MRYRASVGRDLDQSSRRGGRRARSGFGGSGFHEAIVRTQARACSLSGISGKCRRNSTTAVSSPSRRTCAARQPTEAGTSASACAAK